MAHMGYGRLRVGDACEGALPWIEGSVHSRWQACHGMCGSFAMESVAGFARNAQRDAGCMPNALPSRAGGAPGCPSTLLMPEPAAPRGGRLRCRGVACGRRGGRATAAVASSPHVPSRNWATTPPAGTWKSGKLTYCARGSAFQNSGTPVPRRVGCRS